jgi:hypothetical protein
LGEAAVNGAGDDGEEHVEVDVERHGGGQGVEVKEGDAVGQAVLDQHALGVARDDGLERGGAIVGEQDRRLVVPEVADQELPERPIVVAQLHPLVDHTGGLELAVRYVEFDRAPRRAGQGRAGRQQCRRAAPEGDEGDAQGVERGQIAIGREFGAEDQMARPGAVLLLPEGDGGPIEPAVGVAPAPEMPLT